jgi:hypothetical protein
MFYVPVGMDRHPAPMQCACRKLCAGRLVGERARAAKRITSSRTVVSIYSNHCMHNAPYSITLSATASRVAGTSRPSAFAVLRLMASSNFVGACTGRSFGFSPFKMRST